MADITLSNGREITFDFSKLTLREYRQLFDKKQTPDEEDRIVSLVSGIPLEEYQDMTYLDWKRLLLAFFKRSREPVDPN